MLVLAAWPAAALQVQSTIQIDGPNGPIVVQVPAGVGGGVGVGIGGGVVGGQVNIQDQPARDTPPPRIGTGRIRGRVVVADGSGPLRRASVRMNGQGGPGGPGDAHTTTTDGDGRYEFASLPSGRFTVTATKPGYIATSSKPLDLADNQHADTVNISVPRGGVFTGRVLDEFGDPVTNAQVTAMRSTFQQGRRQLQPNGSAQTNDIGEFRIFGLAANQYYVAVSVRANNVVVNGQLQIPDDQLGYATIYYPGTPDATAASKLTVAAGQTVSDITVQLTPTRLAKITGTAFDADGRPMTRGNVTAMPRGGALGLPGSNGQIKPDGTFIIPNVSPGDYSLRATQPPTGPPAPGTRPAPPQFSMATVTVSGADITDIALYAVKPVRVRGRIVFDDQAAAASIKASTIRITAQMANPQDSIPIAGGPGAQPTAKDDLTFEITASPGVAILRAFVPASPGPGGAPPTPWQVKAIWVRGVNVIDTGAELKGGEDLSDVEIDLTNRAQKLSGQVLDASGQPAKDFALLLFSQDRSRWTNVTNRYWAVARPQSQGGYQISSLPPGDYYAMALDTVDVQVASDPDFLESLTRDSTQFSLLDGETKTLDFKLSAR